MTRGDEEEIREWRAERGYPLRCDENSAEVIDKQRFVIRPLCRCGCKLLKKKGLKTGKAKAEKMQGWGKEIGEGPFEAQYE